MDFKYFDFMKFSVIPLLKMSYVNKLRQTGYISVDGRTECG